MLLEIDLWTRKSVGLAEENSVQSSSFPIPLWLSFCVFLAVAWFFLWEGHSAHNLRSRRSLELSATEVQFPFRIAMTRSNSVKNRMEHRHGICITRNVHAHSFERRPHFLGRHPVGSAVDDLAAEIGEARFCVSMSRIFFDERRYRLQVFTKLALALVDLRQPLNQALALLSQKCKFLFRKRLKLLIWVSVNYRH
jgi:hypothetical protein